MGRTEHIPAHWLVWGRALKLLYASPFQAFIVRPDPGGTGKAGKIGPDEIVIVLPRVTTLAITGPKQGYARKR